MGVRRVLEDIVLVVQLSGLHPIMLISLAMRLLRIPQCEMECAELNECVGKLCALLQWPVPTSRDLATLQLPAMAARALVEAACLVDLYHRSTLWCRVRTSRSMLAQLRGMKDRVNSLCELVLRVHANPITDHPASYTNATVISDPLQGAETCDSASDNQRYNGTGQGGADDQSDNTEPEGLESV